MSSLLLILLSAVLISSAALAEPGRWRPFADRDGYTAAAALAVIHLIALPAVTALAWAFDAALLGPLDAHYLRTPAYVAIVVIVAAALEIGLRRRGSPVPARPGFALVLCANGALLGVALASALRGNSLGRAIVFSIGAALAFAVLLLAFVTQLERIRYADVPAPFRQAPIALITAGLMALGCMGFTGLIQE
jgi:electron transport complex protein RnfA